MNFDLPTPNGGRFRKDWGLQNVIGLSGPPPAGGNEHAQHMVRVKIDNFVKRAIYPQQLMVPRQYATTKEGTFVFTTFEGRYIDGVQEQGARVVVQENARQARFVISPLLPSKNDALAWARQHMATKD